MEPAEREGFLSDIYSNGSFLLDLINDLLDLSKAEAGRFELMEEEIYLPDLAQNAIDMVRQLPYAEHIDILDLECRQQPSLRADALRLKQIFLNLLTNAAKFTDGEGEVRMSVDVLPNDAVSVVIADTGRGISEEDLERIMDPFVQASSGQEEREVSEPVWSAARPDLDGASSGGNEVGKRARQGDSRNHNLSSRAPDFQILISSLR